MSNQTTNFIIRYSLRLCRYVDIIYYCGHDSNITPWFKQCWHISVNQQLNPPRPIRINSNDVCIIVQSKTVAIKPDTTWSRSDRNIYSHHQSFHPFTFTPAHAPYEQQNIIISNEIFISCMHQMHKTVQEKQTGGSLSRVNLLICIWDVNRAKSRKIAGASIECQWLA